MSNNLNSCLETLFSKMDSYVSTKTVVGEPVAIGDVIIIPLVDVSFGVGAGALGNEEEKAKKDNELGGLGARITPSAVLVIINGSVQLVNVKNQDSVNKIIDMVPGILGKLNFGDIFSKKKNGTKEDEKKGSINTDDIIITE